jgi:hypothetical protein
MREVLVPLTATRSRDVSTRSSRILNGKQASDTAPFTLSSSPSDLCLARIP